VRTQPTKKDAPPPTSYGSLYEEKLREIGLLRAPASPSMWHPMVKAQQTESRRFYRHKDDALWSRRWSIVNFMCQRLEASGLVVKAVTQNSFSAAFRGSTVTAHVDEHIHQYRRPVTDEERASSMYGNQKWRQIKEPTGRLKFSLYGHFPSDLPCQWLDDDNAPLERRVHEPLAGFLVAIVHEAAREEEGARRYREDQERIRQKEAAKLAREKEAAKRNALLEEVAQWKQALALREFLVEVRANAAPIANLNPACPWKFGSNGRAALQTAWTRSQTM